MRAVIPTIITQLARGDGAIQLGALAPTRDFSFVADTASGIAATAGSEKAIGKVTNIGSGFEISVGDAAALIAEVMGKEVEITQTQAACAPEASEVDRCRRHWRRAGTIELSAGSWRLRRAPARYR